MRITIRLSGIEGLQAALDAGGRRAEQAVRRAINRTATHVRKEAINDMRKDTRFKSAAYLRERMTLRQSPHGLLQASVIARRRGTRLDSFPHRQLTRRGKRSTTTWLGTTVARVKAGIKVSVKKSHGWKTLRQAFLVPLRRGKEEGAGGMGIAMREPGQSRRYEILHTTSVHDAFQDVIEGRDQDFRGHLDQQIRQQLRYAVRRR